MTNARASVGQVKLDPSKAPTDAAELEKFQQAQGQLSTALSRLLVVSENYPQLRATEAFQNLQAQLEGTENRISVERNNFNAAVQEYNTAMQTFPTNMLNKMFGFKEKPFFNAQPGSEKAPSVNFGTFGSSPAPAVPAAPRLRRRRINNPSRHTCHPERSEGPRMRIWGPLLANRARIACALLGAVCLHLCTADARGAEVIPPKPAGYFNDYANVVSQAGSAPFQ